MRFIDQSFDDDTLENHPNRVGAIVHNEPEEGELNDTLEEFSSADLDEYEILAVKTPSGTRRYQVTLDFKNVSLTFMVDTSSPTSFVDRNTSALLMGKSDFRIRPLADSDLKERFTDFNGHRFRRSGFIEVPVRCGDWTTPKAKFYILDDGHSTCRLLGANIMPHIGLALVQTPVNTHPTPPTVVQPIGESSNFSFTEAAKSEFPHLFTRTGSFNNHVVRTKFQSPFIAKQQKGRRVPLALQQRVADELNRLIREGHVERLQGCTDDQFISPIVITAERDESLKLALDSKELNKMIAKNKCQMPNIDDLIDRLAEIIKSPLPGARFSKIDLRYAYRQLKLARETARQCNFSVSGGPATGTYRFKTGFYGLSDLPAEFQQAIDRASQGTTGTFAFLDVFWSAQKAPMLTTGKRSVQS